MALDNNIRNVRSTSYIIVLHQLSLSLCPNQKSLLNYLAACPFLYLNEQIYYLWDIFDVQVDEQCIKHMLKCVKWSKKKVLYIPLFQPLFHKLLIYRCNYVLHNKTPSWEQSGWASYQDELQNSSYSLMNRLQMSKQQIESIVRCWLESPHVKPSHLDALNVGLCVLHIQLMVSSHGRLCMGHFQLNCLRILLKTRFCHVATCIHFHA